MRAFNGFKAERSVGASEPLPAGGYVARIMGAKVEEYSWGDVLVISFDIAEGEYKDFFRKQFTENTRDDKKWKGNFRINVPVEGSQYYKGNLRIFNNAIAAIQQSNPGYQWNWQEDTLKNRMVGVLFRNKEWEMDGNTGWTTECCTFVSVEEIRTGNFAQPKDKPLKNKGATAAPAATSGFGAFASGGSGDFAMLNASEDISLPF